MWPDPEVPRPHQLLLLRLCWDSGIFACSLADLGPSHTIPVVSVCPLVFVWERGWVYLPGWGGTMMFSSFVREL